MLHAFIRTSLYIHTRSCPQVVTFDNDVFVHPCRRFVLSHQSQDRIILNISRQGKDTQMLWYDFVYTVFSAELYTNSYFLIKVLLSQNRFYLPFSRHKYTHFCHKFIDLWYCILPFKWINIVKFITWFHILTSQGTTLRLTSKHYFHIWGHTFFKGPSGHAC